MKGVADSPVDAAESAGCKPDGKALRIAALQRALSHAGTDARAAVLLATLEADAKGGSSQVLCTALADLARFCSCAGSLASAYLTARPGPAELTDVHPSIRARLRLREYLFSGQDVDAGCICGRSTTASGSHSLICGALWHTDMAPHTAMTDAWLRSTTRGGIAANYIGGSHVSRT